MKELEATKQKLENKIKNPKKPGDSSEEEGYEEGVSPYLKKEVSENQKVKEELRQGVKHMVKFTRMS